eukprot:TRINITY_DN7342_c0_g1_i1.p1 TRINITY_DN7342_c0_g1~~TRINITY_DN7342_c0_g1_i1.p1  ORF type:complete len:144 (+),score=41.75 TRINITY_DN7342_c0_g1_i1:210-641(+)
MVVHATQLSELKAALQKCESKQTLHDVLMQLCQSSSEAQEHLIAYLDVNGLSEDARDRSLTLAVSQTDKRLELKKQRSAKEFNGHRLVPKKWKPRAICDVCGLVMKGGLFKKHGMECMTCSKRCHAKCRAKLSDCPLPDFADV